MYNRYFVRTNIKFGRRAKGGWDGEIDVLAYMPSESRLVHIECSAAATTWTEQAQRFIRKFDTAAPYYRDLMGIEPRTVERVAIAGTVQQSFAPSILHVPTSAFFRQIHLELSGMDPLSQAVPETMPLLRAIQFAGWYASRAKATVLPVDRNPCSCGCGGYPKGQMSRYLPGHDARRRIRTSPAEGNRGNVR